MRGYFSFSLVLLSSLLALSLLMLHHQSGQRDLSKAVSVQRAYGLQMNAKESVVESMRQGASAGFGYYDSTHDIAMCKHCPDNFCAPTIPGVTTENACDATLCSACFREADARESAVSSAAAKAAALNGHG